MWGSKTLGRGAGMALATSIFYGYGVNEAFSILLILMSLTFLFPLFSHELSYKAGLKSESYKNRLTLKELVSGVSQSLFLYECSSGNDFYAFLKYWLWYF